MFPNAKLPNQLLKHIHKYFSGDTDSVSPFLLNTYKIFIISIDKGRFWGYNYTNILGWYVNYSERQEHYVLQKQNRF